MSAVIFGVGVAMGVVVASSAITMEHIFGARIRQCWVHDTEGDWICANCQNRGRCMVYGK